MILSIFDNMYLYYNYTYSIYQSGFARSLLGKIDDEEITL